MTIEVIQVMPTDDFKVYVYFSDGKIKLFDAKHLIDKGVFKAISEISYFKETCTVINKTLAWDIGGGRDEYKCLDLNPQTVYSKGIEVKDPLAEDAA